MPAVLIAIFSAVISSLLARLLLGAGLAVFTYTWINDLVSDAQNQMMGLFHNIPSSIFGLISILQVPKHFLSLCLPLELHLLFALLRYS